QIVGGEIGSFGSISVHEEDPDITPWARGIGNFTFDECSGKMIAGQDNTSSMTAPHNLWRRAMSLVNLEQWNIDKVFWDLPASAQSADFTIPVDPVLGDLSVKWELLEMLRAKSPSSSFLPPAASDMDRVKVLNALPSVFRLLCPDHYLIYASQDDCFFED